MSECWPRPHHTLDAGIDREVAHHIYGRTRPVTTSASNGRCDSSTSMVCAESVLNLPRRVPPERTAGSGAAGASGRAAPGLNWKGVVMVEFRRDAGITNGAFLMGVNGRFWRSLPFAVVAGANFPHVRYRTMGEGERVAPTPYLIGVAMKQSVPHLPWFWDAFVRRHRLPPDGFIARGLLSYDPRIRFDIEPPQGV
jgi:hypothetical protein